jgi:hypothetical protein
VCERESERQIHPAAKKPCMKVESSAGGGDLNARRPTIYV